MAVQVGCRILTRNNNLARGDVHGNPTVVKMFDVDSTASKSSEKVDFGLVEKVVVLALETGVGLLLNLEHDIARQSIRHLITLAAELNLVAIAHTLVNVDVEHLALHDSLFPVTLLATVLVFDHLTLTITVRAYSLETLNHGTHLAHHGLHTATVAARTLLDSTFFATTTITPTADDGLLECQLRDLALVNVFEVHLVNVVDGTGFLGASFTHATSEHSTEGMAAAAAAAEELREQILGVHTTTAATALQALLAKLVIELALIGIG